MSEVKFKNTDFIMILTFDTSIILVYGLQISLWTGPAWGVSHLSI